MKTFSGFCAARPARLLILLCFCLCGAFAIAQTPAADSFEGVWLGEVTAPNTHTAIGFAFKRTKDGLMTSFYMPAMFLYNVPFGPAVEKDSAVLFPPLDTKLMRDGEKLVGVFGLSHLPLELHRVEKFSPAPPPPTSPAGPTALWSVSLAAETWASPVVDDGVIYLGCADGKFHAFRAADGQELWTWPGTTPLFGAALVSGDRIYFVDSATTLICLVRQTGELAWRAPLHDVQLAGGPAPANETFNHRTVTPVIVDGVVYTGSTDGGIYALDAAKGTVLWRHDAKSKIYAAPAVAGDQLIFGGYDGSVLVLDRRTQKEIARAKLPGAVVSTPAVTADTIVVGSRDYMLYGLKRADLSIAWRFSYWFSWVESSPALVDGTLYIGGSDFARITALEPATGCAHWSTEVQGMTWGTPLVTRDTVFAGMSAQRTAAIAHDGGIAAIDRATGTMKWRISLPLAAGADRSGCIGSLALAGDKVIAVTFDGRLLAYPAH